MKCDGPLWKEVKRTEGEMLVWASRNQENHIRKQLVWSHIREESCVEGVARGGECCQKVVSLGGGEVHHH